MAVCPKVAYSSSAGAQVSKLILVVQGLNCADTRTVKNIAVKKNISCFMVRISEMQGKYAVIFF